MTPDAVCLTCGVRDDHTGKGGYCQNGHDNWFEYIDFTFLDSGYYDKAKELFQMDDKELTEKFFDNSIKQFTIHK